jgi:hypothetical protein
MSSTQTQRSRTEFPICDTHWDIDELKRIIQAKLKHFENISREREAVEKLLESHLTVMDELETGLAVICRYGPQLTVKVDVSAVTSYREAQAKHKRDIEAFIPLQVAITGVRGLPDVPKTVKDAVTAVEAGITAIPEATEQDAARTYLTIGQERLDVFRKASLQLKKAEDQAVLTKQIHEAYASASTSVLEGMYKQVEKDFTDLYRYINREDEGAFTAELAMPASGKLDFNVDFFGRGYFPPGAYHSEGHQDGMGICLYLALMKHMLGDQFTFAVLDDVLMSVDSGHRREVCNLLKDKFSATQFVFTTHDDIWLGHMKTAGLIGKKSFIHFRTWHVDHGPTKWDDRDVWQQIRDYVAENDIRAAAGLLRHYLEHVTREMCHALRAPVPFRADARYELGDLMPAATAKLRKLLTEGRVAAESWKKDDVAKDIAAREKKFEELVQKSQQEQWQMNPAIHYNEWANFQAADFTPVVNAFEQLVAAFGCANADCGSLLHVLPEVGDREELRCTCGTITINLQKKPLSK